MRGPRSWSSSKLGWVSAVVAVARLVVDLERPYDFGLPDLELSKEVSDDFGLSEVKLSKEIMFDSSALSAGGACADFFSALDIDWVLMP